MAPVVVQLIRDLRHGPPPPRRTMLWNFVRRHLPFMVAFALLASTGLAIVVNRVSIDNTNKALEHRATKAAVVAACEQLNRKIVESQMPRPAVVNGRAVKPDTKPPNALLIAEIVRGMTPARRAEYVRSTHQWRQDLPTADCRREVSDPPKLEADKKAKKRAAAKPARKGWGHGEPARSH